MQWKQLECTTFRCAKTRQERAATAKGTPMFEHASAAPLMSPAHTPSQLASSAESRSVYARSSTALIRRTTLGYTQRRSSCAGAEEAGSRASGAGSRAEKTHSGGVERDRQRATAGKARSPW